MFLAIDNMGIIFQIKGDIARILSQKYYLP